jgi:uncharacterized protein (DUF952 family)
MIFHITSRAEWDKAQQHGYYRAEGFAMEGFIHCSTLAQVLPVANNFYKGQSGLILLEIEPTLLSAELKWEPPTGGAPPPGVAAGDMFPHVYGPINVDAVVRVIDLTSKPDGTFDLPSS